MHYEVGNLELDEDEYKTYLIMLEAMKQCPLGKLALQHERVLHGVDGNNGLATKVRTHEEQINTNRRMLYSSIAVIVTASLTTMGAILIYTVTHL